MSGNYSYLNTKTNSGSWWLIHQLNKSKAMYSMIVHKAKTHLIEAHSPAPATVAKVSLKCCFWCHDVMQPTTKQIHWPGAGTRHKHIDFLHKSLAWQWNTTFAVVEVLQRVYQIITAEYCAQLVPVTLMCDWSTQCVMSECSRANRVVSVCLSSRFCLYHVQSVIFRHRPFLAGPQQINRKACPCLTQRVIKSHHWSVWVFVFPIACCSFKMNRHEPQLRL